MTNGRQGKYVSRRRRGVLLVSILMLVLLASLFVFVFYRFMREEMGSSRHLLAGEVAFNLARAGLAAGLAHFGQAAEPGELHRACTSLPADSVNGLSEVLDVDSHPVLRAMVDEYGYTADLTVELSLLGFRSVFPSAASTSGVQYNDIEKSGTVRVRAYASYESGHRCITAYKAVKVVNTLPYVVSKFTLFGKSVGREASREVTARNFLNTIAVRRRSLYEGDRDRGRSDTGILTLSHGLADDVEDRGWCLVGNESALFLNIAHGRGEWGESHHLLKGPYEVTSQSARGPKPGYVSRFLQNGFFSDIHDEAESFDLFDFAAPRDDPMTERASALRLFGSALQPSATIILGRLFRRFLMFRFVHKQATRQTIYLPFGQKHVWSSPPLPYSAPPQPFDPRWEAFDNDYDRYHDCMSSTYAEPYNRAVDFILSPTDGMVKPRLLMAPTRLKHLDDLEDFLYRPEKNQGRVRMYTNGGALLFQGDLREVASDALALRERATFSAPDEAFAGFLATEPRRIPGIIHFAGERGVTIDNALSLDDGGVIACDGPLVIGASVSAQGRPLVLVSLEGDIVVTTSTPIGASLVALNGRLDNKAPGDVTIHGNVVVGQFLPEDLLADGRDVSVTYDERLDVTRPGDGEAYVVNFSPARLACQER